jgi:hypothetical protein
MVSLEFFHKLGISNGDSMHHAFRYFVQHSNVDCDVTMTQNFRRSRSGFSEWPSPNACSLLAKQHGTAQVVLEQWCCII